MSTYFEEGELKSDGTNVQSKSPFTKLGIYFEALNDKIKNYFLYRWIVIIVLFLFFLIRLIITKGSTFLFHFFLGYHAVAYCLAIHLLNSLIGFLSPLEDPEDEQFVVSGDSSFLPTKFIYLDKYLI